MDTDLSQHDQETQLRWYAFKANPLPIASPPYTPPPIVYISTPWLLTLSLPLRPAHLPEHAAPSVLTASPDSTCCNTSSSVCCISINHKLGRIAEATSKLFRRTILPIYACLTHIFTFINPSTAVGSTELLLSFKKTHRTCLQKTAASPGLRALHSALVASEGVATSLQGFQAFPFIFCIST
jgi:hypothetical protein